MLLNISGHRGSGAAELKLPCQLVSQQGKVERSAVRDELLQGGIDRFRPSGAMIGS
jgi:hypothetical protein